MPCLVLLLGFLAVGCRTGSGESEVQSIEHSGKSPRELKALYEGGTLPNDIGFKQGKSDSPIGLFQCAMSPSFKAEWTVYGFDLEKKSFQIRYASKWLDCEIASDAWSCKNNSNEKMSFKQNKDVLMREHIYRVEDKGEGMEITVHYPCKFVTCSNLPNKKCPDPRKDLGL
jgi:hypothetical protein